MSMCVCVCVWESVCVACHGQQRTNKHTGKKKKKILRVPLCQCLGSIDHLAKSVCACAYWVWEVCVGQSSVCVCVCVCVVCFSSSPSSSQSCLYLSVMVVPCCLHRASRGSAMNCSVISVNILAPLESRIFSISLTYRRRRRRRRRGGGDGGMVTHTPAHAWSLYKQNLQRTNTHDDTTNSPQTRITALDWTHKIKDRYTREIHVWREFLRVLYILICFCVF